MENFTLWGRRVALLGALFAVLSLGACLSDGPASTAGGATANFTGRFVDATVVGLEYKCGTSTAVSGKTNANGEFTCPAGQAVAFYVGDILIGSVAVPTGIVTPLDLVGLGATPSNTTVANIVRFLMSISSTDPASGTITIDAAVATAAAGKTADFSVAAATALDTLITAIKSGATVYNSTQAAAHVTASIGALFAGDYSGTYSGAASGVWAITIGGNGAVTGSVDGVPATVTGNMATTLSTGSTYGFTGTGNGVTWAGTLNVSTKVFSGTWDDGVGTGKFTGTVTTPASGGGGTNALTVSGVTPSNENGTYNLSTATETLAGGTSTAKRVEFTDGTRTLRLYYQPATGALENMQYAAPGKSFNCFYGDPFFPCPSNGVTFTAASKTLVLTSANFTDNSPGGPSVTLGILTGTLTW